MATFSNAEITAISLRMSDPDLGGLAIMRSVTVALNGGGAVHGLLCRRIRTRTPQSPIPPTAARWTTEAYTEEVIVYYDRNTDRMVAHVVGPEHLGWLARLGVR